MLVFQAVLSAGSGDERAFWFFSGEVAPYNLEELYASVIRGKIAGEGEEDTPRHA